MTPSAANCISRLRGLRGPPSRRRPPPPKTKPKPPLPPQQQQLRPYAYTPRPFGPHDIDVEISHCGICGSDIHTIDSGWGPTKYPVVVGHEIVGKVVRAGASVPASLSAPGTLVGVGTLVHSCQTCDLCVAGLDNHCAQKVWTYNDAHVADPRTGRRDKSDAARTHGGYASHPSSCHPPTTPTPRAVGVAGIGGLGHLALQFAAKMLPLRGSSTAPHSRALALSQLGATDFCVLADAADRRRLRGALDLLLVTADVSGDDAVDRLLSLVKPATGRVVFLAMPERRIAASPSALVSAARAIEGVQETLRFAAEHGVRPWVEVMEMEDVNEAVAKVRRGEPRFRMVLQRTNKTTFGGAVARETGKL
ncbi:putative mannitol dehydrogenase [Zopfochytrium polystomum]|nr:putative mannitol dehydrogenase [Zopfochytrium polystomum]